jgi:hypothetical protein
MKQQGEILWTQLQSMVAPSEKPAATTVGRVRMSEGFESESIEGDRDSDEELKGQQSR